MKRILVMAVLLGCLGGRSSAQMGFLLDAPQDDLRARLAVRDRLELNPLRAAYWELIQTRIFPLKKRDVYEVFGPVLASNTNWWVYNMDPRGKATFGPALARHPHDMVLPMFIPETMTVSGLHSPEPRYNQNHTDFHAVGDTGYAEFYYANDGDRLESALLFFRADDKFVPLNSTNDFAKRLEWEKSHFEAMKKWLQAKLPPLVDLGEVAVSPEGPNRLDLGGGTVCIFKTQGMTGNVVEFPYRISLEKENTNAVQAQDTNQVVPRTPPSETGAPHQGVRSRPVEATPPKANWRPPVQTFTEVRTIDHPGQMIGFEMDGKFYRLKPKVVGKLGTAGKSRHGDGS